MTDHATKTRRRPLIATTLLLSSIPSIAAVECNYCEGKSTGFIPVPGTSCSQYVQCANGQIANNLSCGAGLVYDQSISQCNWETGVTCAPDFECPTEEPTLAPSEKPTEMPTVPEYPPTKAPVGGKVGGRPVSSGGYNTQVAPSAATMSNAEVGPNTPLKEAHHAAVFAHLSANKINLHSNIFSRAKKIYEEVNVKSESFRQYSYLDFIKALRTMSEIGYTVPLADEDGNDISYRNTFYLGDATSIDGAAVGLVNVALFLSQALAESFLSGSCDEVNNDSFDGYLPTSNSCGQYGLSYQDMHCDLSEAHLECPLDYGMQLTAGPNPQGVTPFYCGSTDVHPFTGVANYRGLPDTPEFPVQNRDGRTDVENCCWWGRGVINTRGVCQYGKLNYYLGARAKEEGRSAIYPDIDFCYTPQQICSQDPHRGDVEWVAGLFRWVDAVQSYNHPEWSYIPQLNQFVMGGMQDGFFIRAVTGILTQGCHLPPCEGSIGSAIDLMDAGERWDQFQKVAQTFGLPVKSVQL